MKSKKILKHKKFITSMLMDSTVNKFKLVTLNEKKEYHANMSNKSLFSVE